MNAVSRKISTDVRRLPGPGGAAVEGPELFQPVQDFKDFIETNPMAYADFVRMIDGMTESVSILYYDYSKPKHSAKKKKTPPAQTYRELLLMYNEIFRQAPNFGSLGPPMYDHGQNYKHRERILRLYEGGVESTLQEHVEDLGGVPLVQGLAPCA